MEDINQRNARIVIRGLGTSGQPPRIGARLINAGTDRILRRLNEEYLLEHCAPFEGMDGGGACKWVEADYGNGKTQFLRCVQEYAWEANFLTAYVELSQDECPLDRPDKVFGEVARKLQAAPLDPAHVDRTQGLDVALCQLVDRKFDGVFTGVPDEEQRDQALEWINALQNTPVESTAIVTAAVKHLNAQLAGDEEAAMVSGMFLRGEPVPAAELKPLGIYEKLDKSSGFRFLRSVSQFVQRSGLANGVVILFDEARRTLSLMSTKGQKVACENLLSVINRCNSGELPGTLFLYAVMPEFFTNFATNYPALQQRCGPATRINLNHLQGIKEVDLLHEIGDKIESVFRSAYDDFPEGGEILRSNLNRIGAESIREAAGTGSRRLFVRSWVKCLQDVRLEGVRQLTEEDVERLVAGSSEELSEVDVATVAAEGE